MNISWRFPTALLLTVPLLLLATGGAWAVTPANTIIRNSATLTGTGLPAGGLTASVDVKVNLVPQKPTLSKATVLTQMPDDNAATQGGSSTASYRLTTNANGPDTFTISYEYAATNLTGDSGVATYTLTSIPLGATAAAVGSAGTAITVPYDGTSDSIVNGIELGDKVHIDGNDFTVSSVSEDAAGNSATIHLNAAASVTAGMLIQEYKTFDMTVANVGAVDIAGTDAFIVVSTKATSQANNALFDADSATDAAGNGSNGHRTSIVSVSFKKFIRNVIHANGSGSAFSFNSQEYYPTAGGVTASPGDELEYALVITTTAAGLANGVVTDTVPAFTDYQANSTYRDGSTPIPDGGGGILPLIGGYTLGDIAGAETIVITFKVKVKEN